MRRYFHELMIRLSYRSDYLTITHAAAGIILLGAACSRSESSRSEDSPVALTESVSTATPAEETFMADYDIGMTVRSVADAINVGESLDSTAYNFEGVLTDGVGMPLFTDMSGMPGEWEVEVVDSTQVRIRNIDAGDLQPFQLIEYLTANLNDGSHEILLENECDRGEAHIINYRYGRTSLRVETRPRHIGDTGEVAPVMEITLRADSVLILDTADEKLHGQTH